MYGEMLVGLIQFVLGDRFHSFRQTGLLSSRAAFEHVEKKTRLIEFADGVIKIELFQYFRMFGLKPAI